MCELSKILKSTTSGAVLYADSSPVTQEMRRVLDSEGAHYSLARAEEEAIRGPVLVVDGSFLDIVAVKEAFNGGQRKNGKKAR